ncbi:ComF family protein [Gaoshiqia sp. Z1-71]|uniref:ComF family protein n=1 Tax=Gaoshiqia hydrogeniformans TaxID=3290090 RepID=UPI003BF7E610
MKTQRSNLFDCFLELIFPRICVVCGQRLIQTEQHLCLSCLLHLPRTNFHTQRDNPMERLFYGRVPIENASAYFEFRKGSDYQKILHRLKYQGQKEIGEYLGERFGYEISGSDVFSKTDLICPVPLHPKKERKRGYNQSYHIALGLSKALNTPVDHTNLRRTIYTDTQTRRSRFNRWQNVEGIFDVADPGLFDGKHLVLVDDVITTGSTLEACATAILRQCQAKISILTLAIA